MLVAGSMVCEGWEREGDGRGGDGCVVSVGGGESRAWWMKRSRNGQGERLGLVKVGLDGPLDARPGLASRSIAGAPQLRVNPTR